MNALLICPHDRPGVPLLAERQPLALLTACGRPLVEYWLEHLAILGVKQVTILASDRPQEVRRAVGQGKKWGLQVEVVPQSAELSPEEARQKFQNGHGSTGTIDVVVIDRLPGQTAAFDSYESWFRAVQQFSRCAKTPTRIGLRELRPGVWVGMRTRIDRRAQLMAPCWIGDGAQISAEAVVGPHAIIENGCLVEASAQISDSVVAPGTFVGAFTEIRDSIAVGSLLINWRRCSHVNVPDPFLLGPVDVKPFAFDPLAALGRVTAALVMLATVPLPLYVCLKCAARGQPSLRQVNAVRLARGLSGSRLQKFSFYEFTNVNRWVRRWPQLWSIVCGDLCWVGNRPISASKASRLHNDFERLWLHAPTGLVSLADVRGWMDSFSDEARAHSCFYAVQRNWRLDMQILGRAPMVFLVSAAERLWENEYVPMPVRQWLRAEYPTIHRT